MSDPRTIPMLKQLLRGTGTLQMPESGGLLVLIKGAPGVGKTTLGLQMASCLATTEGKSFFYTFEQEKTNVEVRYKKLAGGEGGGCLKLLDISGLNEPVSPTEPFITTSFVLDATMKLTHKLHSIQEKQYHDVLAVDGLNLLSSKEMEVLEIERLIREMRRTCRVGIMVLEPSHLVYNAVDYHCDMVIELRGRQINPPIDYYINEISIVKSRFQPSVLGWHQYKIRDNGIEVFPSVHYRLHGHRNIKDKFEDSKHPWSDVTEVGGPDIFLRPSLEGDSLMHKFIGKEGLKEGSCTVVLGPRRTSKTQLTLDFLRDGSRCKQASLLVSLIDNQGTIIRQRTCLCDEDCKANSKSYRESCENKKCYKDLFLMHFPPGCITSSEVFHWLEERFCWAEQKEQPVNVKRLVFWDLTQLESRFPLLARDPMFLSGVIDYLKYSRPMGVGDTDKPRLITSVLMGAPNTDLGRTAAAMADNVIFTWRDSYKKIKKQQGVAIYVNRIEGQPGEESLYFIPDIPKDKRHDVPKIKIKHIERQALLANAKDEVEKIWKMQGLS